MKFTKEQREKLLPNPNVLAILIDQIRYTEGFKLYGRKIALKGIVENILNIV